jgi:hypothetical protein
MRDYADRAVNYHDVTLTFSERTPTPPMRTVLLLALLSAAACQNPRPAAAPVPEPAPRAEADTADREPRLLLNPGARVKMRLRDRRVVTGHVLVPYTFDSTHIVVCPDGSECAGPGAPAALTLRADSLRSLSVRGRADGLGGYMGALLGGLAGLTAEEETDSEGGLFFAAGVFAGMFAGSRIGSWIVDWISVFPCFHGCAYGVYPDDPQRPLPPREPDDGA